MMNEELDKYTAAPDSIKVELTVQEVNTVLAALAELPHRVADPVIRKVFAQAQEQTKQ